ncbi:glutamate--tRNA ligase, partial [Patescibacteria group bacterium]|nr:glutamate--tRNA ligase [Patescibacteria group bacterium]
MVEAVAETTKQKFVFKIQEKVRVRFAPSPTGYFHIGSARTALFNYLFAKHNGGDLILRIEDTDKERSKPEFTEDIIESLKWLGIEWEEGPYLQSERISIYKNYLEKLLEEGRAYYCFCTPEELEAKRQEQMGRGIAPIYDGRCANLPLEEAREKIKKGEKAIIRFKILPKKVHFNDLIRGKIEFDTSLIGDVAIAKDLETPLYNFSVVVDDYEMKISHVIRGEDTMPNTPKQILLQEALGFDKVEYAHLPIILGTDRSKLSKRDGATSLRDYRDEGYLPEAFINFLAFLGWNPGTEKEIFTLDNLIKEFSLEKVQKSGAIFNLEKLTYLNGFYIRHLSLDKLTELCLPYFDKGTDEEYLKKAIALYQERLKKLSEIGELLDYFFKQELQYEPELLIWKKSNKEEVKDSIDKTIEVLYKIEDWNIKNIEASLMTLADEIGDRGRILWPLRVALSGKKASAGPFEIAEVLGKEKTIKRLQEASKLL